MKSSLPARNVQILLILLLSSGVFLGTFQNDFVWDDFDFIVNWHEVQSWDTSLLWDETPHPGSYRPITNLYYFFTFKLWKGSAFGYHLHSLIMHALATVLVFFIVEKVFPKGAFMTALLFGLHPIHTEVVAFMTSTYDLAAVFFLASLYFHMEEKKAHSLLFAGLAFFTYEMALALPFIIVLYDYSFKKVDLRKDYAKYTHIFLLAILYLGIRSIVPYDIERGGYLGGSVFTTLAVSCIALLQYARLHVLPYPLNVNHEIAQGIFSYRRDILSLSIDPLLVMAGLLFVGFALYMAHRQKKKHPVMTFSTGVFFLSLLPALNLVPQAALFAERYAYMATFGFALLVVYGIFQLPKQYRNGVFCVLLISCALLSIDRVGDWRNEETLWTATVEQSPDSVLVLNNLGIVFEKQQRTQEAIATYERLLSVNPNYVKAHNNLASIYFRAGDLEKAIVHYEQSIILDPSYVKGYANLGAAYHRLGVAQKAYDNYAKALELDPNHVTAHFNIAQVYLAVKDVNKARKHLEAVVRLDPDYPGAVEALRSLE